MIVQYLGIELHIFLEEVLMKTGWWMLPTDAATMGQYLGIASDNGHQS